MKREIPLGKRQKTHKTPLVDSKEDLPAKLGSQIDSKGSNIDLRVSILNIKVKISNLPTPTYSEVCTCLIEIEILLNASK